MAVLITDALVTLGKELDDYWASTTTSIGGAAGATLIDTALLEKVADWIIDGMVVYLPLGPDGASAAETRVVDSLSSSTLTPKTAFSAQVQSGVSYEIHRLFTRSQKLIALRESAKQLFPDYFAVVRNISNQTTDYKYEFDISSLGIFQNRPHQVLIAQQTIRNIWVAATAYSVGDYVRPTALSTFTGYTYKCTTAGTSHATTEPTWPTTSSGTVTDNTVVWTRQDDLDYSNYPMLPIHDWDVTPDGKLFFPGSFTAGYKICIVGIKQLTFTGSGATETIALTAPHDQVLTAKARIYLANQKLSQAPNKDISTWAQIKQLWEQEFELTKAKYPMKAPEGTLIFGAGLTV